MESPRWCNDIIVIDIMRPQSVMGSAYSKKCADKAYNPGLSSTAKGETEDKVNGLDALQMII
jgi:DNA-binding response OmpR family regulator